MRILRLQARMLQSIDFIMSIDAINRNYRNAMDLKLKDLRYLVALADERHFGRAAAKCFVSQPTLSTQLRKLEEYLGVQLIERRPRKVSLTEAGEEIALRARSMLESGDAIVATALTRRDPLAGQLRVALLPTIGPYLLPRVALKIRKALPRLDLMLYEYQTGPLLERLHHGDIDVGILALPIHEDGLVSRELYHEPFVAAVPADHPLASRARVHAEDLQGETLLLLEDGHCLRDQALAVCSISGAHESQDFRATSLETLRQMVATGAGVTLLPQLATLGSYANTRGLAIRPFAKPVPTRTIGALWRKSTARAAAIEAVCDQIKRYQ
jgi:LysR family transcriptional regulator, hydrogen peroxide-inducible genes activator